MSDLNFVDSLYSNATIATRDGSMMVSTTSCANTSTPVVLRVGPFSALLTIDEARDLGATLVEAAHNWQAALAEYRQFQADQAADGAAQGAAP